MRTRTALLAITALIASSVAVLPSSVASAQPTSAPSDPNPATTTTTPTGRFVPKTPARVLDTRYKIGVTTTTPLRGGDTRTISLDASGLPSSATSVVLNLGVAESTDTGYLTMYAAGTTRPSVSSLNFQTGTIGRNLVVVPLGSGNKINLYVGTSGSTHVVADLTGYFQSSTSGNDDNLGGFGSAASRVLGASVAGRSNLDVTVIGGGAAIPDDASAVLVNLTVSQSTAAGYATLYPKDGALPKGATAYFAKGPTRSSFAVVPVGSNGKVTLWNGSAGAARFYVDIEGYVGGGDPTTVGAIGSLPSRRLLDTTTPLGANRTTTFDTAGKGGVPLSRVAQVVVSLTASGPAGSGYLTAYSGARPSAATLNYARATTSNVAIVTPDSAGRITIYNGSTTSTNVLADVVGYVLKTALPIPATTTSRYVTDPDAISGSGASSEGCTDGASGATFVLLDVGAQSITAPLSAANPGVALARTHDPVVRLTYAQLVADLDDYLAEFARCQHSGATARIAVGTNNDGDYSGPYTATQRGRDWANQVVDALDPPSGVTVVGADDIEAGFASTEAQAEQWINSYFANTAVNLVYNGSLDNCPDAYGSTAECGAVNDDNDPAVRKTWTRAQYVRLTYGLEPGRITVLPQIYFNVPNQAGQWSNLFTTSGGKLTFEGALSQFSISGDVTSGFTGAQSWSALYHALSTIVANPSLPVASDLHGH